MRLHACGRMFSDYDQTRSHTCTTIIFHSLLPTTCFVYPPSRTEPRSNGPEIAPGENVPTCPVARVSRHPDQPGPVESQRSVPPILRHRVSGWFRARAAHPTEVSTAIHAGCGRICIAF